MHIFDFLVAGQQPVQIMSYDVQNLSTECTSLYIHATATGVTTSNRIIQFMSLPVSNLISLCRAVWKWFIGAGSRSDDIKTVLVYRDNHTALRGVTSWTTSQYCLVRCSILLVTASVYHVLAAIQEAWQIRSKIYSLHVIEHKRCGEEGGLRCSSQGGQVLRPWLCSQTNWAQTTNDSVIVRIYSANVPYRYTLLSFNILFPKPNTSRLGVEKKRRQAKTAKTLTHCIRLRLHQRTNIVTTNRFIWSNVLIQTKIPYIRPKILYTLTFRVSTSTGSLHQHGSTGNQTDLPDGSRRRSTSARKDNGPWTVRRAATRTTVFLAHLHSTTYWAKNQLKKWYFHSSDEDFRRWKSKRQGM